MAAAGAPLRVSHLLVLIDRPGHPPLSGAENHLMELMPALAARGVDTELICLLWSDGPQAQAAFARLRAAGVRVTIVRRPGWSVAGRLGRAIACWWQLLSVLSRRRERLLHLHLELFVFPVLARLAGCRRWVVSYHNDQRYYARPLWRFWLHRVDGWTRAHIGITDHVRRWVGTQARLAPRRIRTVYYGVPQPPVSARTRADLGLPEDGFVAGFVGRLTPQKNLPLLISAVARLPWCTLAIVGAGADREALEAHARSLGAGNVRFLGAIPGAAGVMPRFDVFCLSSAWEGLGLVLVEAMLQEVPVIGSGNGAIPEVLGAGRWGVVVRQDDPAAWAEAITALRDDPAGRRDRAVRARQHAQEAFTIPAMAEATITCYRQAVAR